MKIILIRLFCSQHGVDGTLKINGKRVCDTCEHPDHCLPLGTYEVKMGGDRRAHCMAPQLQGGACVRAGNGPFGCTDGGIVVGERYMAGVLVKTAEAFIKLCDKVRACGVRHEKVTMEIRDI